MNETEMTSSESTAEDRWPSLNIKAVLLLLVLTACMLVSISYMLYLKNPNHKYDVARPGEETKSADIAGDTKADTKSKVSASVMKQKIDFLEKQTITIDNIHDFSSHDVSDEAILLEPSE